MTGKNIKIISRQQPARAAGIELKPMKQEDLANARNPDLRASLAAMQRAATAARQLALQTDTAIVLVEEGRPVRIPAERLRQLQAEHVRAADDTGKAR